MKTVTNKLHFAVALLIAVLVGLLAQDIRGQSPAFVEQPVTVFRPVQQRVIVPVREYRVQERWESWWNPFREPRLVTRHVPVTRWEERQQTSYIPVIERRYFAQSSRHVPQAAQQSPGGIASPPSSASATPAPFSRVENRGRY
jgi:hypothetical protein